MVGLALVLGACAGPTIQSTTGGGSPGSSGSPAASAALPTPASASSVVDPTPVPTPAGQRPTPTATPPGQTDTEWGRIWDALPPSFPRFPGAEPTETGEGPASATLAVAAEPAVAANWYATALARAGYGVEGAAGPFENGGYVVDATGARGCHVQVSIAPVGSTTVATVMFGAACPFR
jgi:hypothetical protein